MSNIKRTYSELYDYYHDIYDSGEISETYLEVLLSDLRKRFGGGLSSAWQPSVREVDRMTGNNTHDG